MACKIGKAPQPFCDSIKVEKDPFLASDDMVVYTSNLDKHESRIEAELQDTWTLSPDLRVVYGAGIQDSRADSLHYFNGKVFSFVFR